MSEQQYDRICKDRFDKIDTKLDKMFDKLFEDNGGECLQSKINANKAFTKTVTKWFTVIGTAMIGAIVWLFKTKI